ncbi:glycoside hydrolase family 13 protein [Georgenia wangjunii]|uniref:glycoside hydrolase family 13 protein n=1 Tax=Georgenia wangjunii TaxID=3117730 RepID=UPI002F2669C1
MPVRTADWWKSAVVYQVYPRSFADSDGDGIGDLRGIIERLDHIAALGADVIWLSPIYRSPQDDNGYDISDYEDIDPTFGTLEDVDDLIAAVHARGMKLVMDLVVNHTSDEHAWFAQSRASKDSPKRDWYWWRPPREGHEGGTPGAEPTNWESFFSGSTWEWDEATGEYYLHLFSRKQPDLNWENPDVRRAVYAMMRWWVDRGVDGFRMDVINLISKDVAADGSLPDGVVTAGSRFGDGSPHYTGGPRIHELLAEMHAEALADKALLTVGEMPGVTIDEARQFTDPARKEVDMVFTFEHMGLDHGPGGKWDSRPLRLTDLKANLGAWQEGLADVGWNSLYWNNHDQPRVVSRFGDDSYVHRVPSAKTLGTVLHMLRGTPYVYQGEELGMTNVELGSIADYRDIETLNHYRHAVEAGAEPTDVLAGIRPVSRDNARTPMQWDSGANAGFTSGEPWLALNPSYPEINAEAAVADEGSVFHHYRRLIALRHTRDVVVHGDFTMLVPADEQVFAYTRSLEGTTLLVVANLSSEPATAELAGCASLLGGELLLGTHDDGAPASGERVALAPWESRVLLAR